MIDLSERTMEELLDLTALVASQTIRDMNRIGTHGVKTSNRLQFNEFLRSAKDTLLDQGLETLQRIGEEIKTRRT